MTVFDNIAFGLEIAKMPKKQIKERVFELLELTGLSDLEKIVIQTSYLVDSDKELHSVLITGTKSTGSYCLMKPFAAIDAESKI